MVDIALDAMSGAADSGSPEDEAIDEDVILQRYNTQLPPSYRSKLDDERKLLIRALRVLLSAILSEHEAQNNEPPDDDLPDETEDASEEDAIVSEGYQNSTERDLAALEKGINKFLDLKHIFSDDEFPLFFNVVLRGALSPYVDLGLRSKLARCANRILGKRQCVLPDGVDWRPIMRQVLKVHIDCVDGSPYLGRDVRDSHCRHFTSLLLRSRNYLKPDDGAERIWNEFLPHLETKDIDGKFQELLLLNHVLPTRGASWSGWFDQGMQMWKSVLRSSDWDSIWMGFFGRLSRHQPCKHDFTDHLPWIYSRLVHSFRLPLGGLAPNSPVDRRCPHQCYFLMDGKSISTAASIIVYSLSEKHPETLQHLEKLFALIANYFHPSNSGRWSGSIGSFLVHVTGNLAIRVCDERNARKAGMTDRVLSNKTQRGIAPEEHRLSDEYIEKLVNMLLPLVHQGLHSKAGVLSTQSASAARDLALILPDKVVEPLILQAADGLVAVSSPHRTTAALRLLAAMTPVFLDPEICPRGGEFLPQALQLTLPGIDPNDLGKTESTLRFIAAASARLQSTLPQDRMPGIEEFLQDYVHELLEKIFALLESLEAPSKKHRGGGSQLSYFIFSVAVENLFASLPSELAVSAAQRVARRLVGAACTNGMKFYGCLVRVAASCSAAMQGGSSVPIFIPLLIDSLLEEEENAEGAKEETLVTINEDELVWRIRMLAQACRAVGTGLGPHLPKISSIVRLAFDKPTRPSYKAGGRLLRGVLEGLTSIQMDAGSSEEDDAESNDKEALYKFKWRIPSSEEWKQAEELLLSFVARAEELAGAGDDSKSELVTCDRDVLFRVLRMLHAIQRGGRWILAGALPSVYKSLDKFLTGDDDMTKREAKLILKRPVAAGLGGERSSSGEEFAEKTWVRIYSLVSTIMQTVVKTRPDDGALLYRSLEPIELAHEPFRKGERSRQPMHASRAYKSAYKLVVTAKRPLGAEGGVGRAMPRFILKLRVEAHHEMRLSIGARGGLTSPSLCETLVGQITDFALNDFPKVRGEARGVLTRALRIVRPAIRRRETERIIGVLKSSTDLQQGGGLSSSTNDTSELDVPMATTGVLEPSGQSAGSAENEESASKPEIKYEKMIGSSTILRSMAIAPMVMRDWSLFTLVIKALVEVMPKAERADGMHAVTALLAKLSSLTRPLGLEPIRIVSEDFKNPSSMSYSREEQADRAKRLKAYHEINEFLLSALKERDEKKNKDTPIKNGLSPSDAKTEIEAHWRSQVLVASILYMGLREDREPPASVARFFIEGVVSDVVVLRQICAKAVSLILAVHGRRASQRRVEGPQFDDSSSAWSSLGKGAVAAIASTVNTEDFAKQLVYTLALDHDDGSEGSGRSRFGAINGGGGAVAFMGYPRQLDGDTNWNISSGRHWPTSWSPRSRDSLDIVRMRFYETLMRVFGMNFYKAILPTIRELLEKIKTKQDRIIEGVKDEDVKVITAELLAAVCRGLDREAYSGKEEEETIAELTVTLLKELSGPKGNVNGATMIRLINTAEPYTVGSKVSAAVIQWVLESKPLIVPMGSGPVAHLQARRLRYLHSCVADIEDSKDERIIRFVRDSVGELFSTVGFDHEMKTVREEVARCLSFMAVDISDSCREPFEEQLSQMLTRLHEVSTLERKEDTLTDGEDLPEDENKKSRSRQGETLSRFTYMVSWNGRGKGFERYVPVIMPSLFASFNESDPERISHARMALSLIAQGNFSQGVTDEIVSAVERIANDQSWKVRGSVLPFAQVFSFISLFSSSAQSLRGLRNVVVKLLADTQLEIRQHAAGAFVPLIRDADPKSVEEVRLKCMQVLKETNRKGRGSKRPPLDVDTMRRRHGAVLGLSSMIVSAPYTVPSWMPSVLVGLSSCVNDGPPISTGVRKLFADFMRTHRDEWQTHKLAFTPDELEIVSELLVSPSYYA